MAVHGIHHVTALCGDAQRNYDFYTGVLGLRLVKATVNYDHPEGWHLYYGDAAGSPGSIITFFPGYQPGSAGLGQVGATAFSVPAGTLGVWQEKLQAAGVPCFGPEEEFEDMVLHFVDPDDMPLELVESSVPAETPAITGLHSVKLFSRDPKQTYGLARDLFSARELMQEYDTVRLAVGQGVGSVVDVVFKHGAGVGRPGAGTFHHVAFRVEGLSALAELADRAVAMGAHTTEIKDRTYFQSVYFREPGGILFELATDGPGFDVNEPVAELGTHLCLPEQFEGRREELKGLLPAVALTNGVKLP